MPYTLIIVKKCTGGLILFLKRLRYLAAMICKVIKRGTYWGRNYCIDDERKLIYIAICKVASTSFRSVFLCIPKFDDHESFKKHVRAANNYKANIDLNEYGDYYKFSFVRNPFARLVSCYEQKYHWKLKRQFFRFYLMGYLAKDRGFAEFVRRITNIPHFLADRHFCRQYDLLYDKKGKPIYDYLGHLESLNADFEPIRERFNLSPLPHFRTSASSFSDWRDYYDETLAKLVFEYYRNDVEKLGYAKDYESLLEYIREKREKQAV